MEKKTQWKLPSDKMTEEGLGKWLSRDDIEYAMSEGAKRDYNVAVECLDMLEDHVAKWDSVRSMLHEQHPIAIIARINRDEIQSLLNKHK